MNAISKFFALSRTTHGILDLAAPGFCALLWLGHFPPGQTILLSLATAFAAYTAIYALNDLLGIRCDREKSGTPKAGQAYSVEASAQRHPLAQGLLSVRSGLLWMCSWLMLALIGSYVMNPTIVWVLLAATGLEALYCKLQNVTPFRTLVSGMVKSAGQMAAVLVVDRQPAPFFLFLLFAWVFTWEIGGQNIPSDWNHNDDDQRAAATSIPIRYGLRKAGLLILSMVTLTVSVSAFLPMFSPAHLGWVYLLASVVVGYFLLLRPAYELYRSQATNAGARLFDRASYYPLAQMLLIAGVILGGEILA